MSRIGKLPVSIPAGVTVTLKDNVVNVKGPKGELSQFVNPAIEVEIADGHVVLKENENAMLDNLKQRHAFHGLYRALIHNMVVGVSEGFKKELEMHGVGYRAQLQGTKLVLSVGKSHQDEVEAPEGITFEVPSATSIVVSGINKEVVGQTAAYIRSLRSPEPYKGKGIRYVGEYVRRKEGKTGK